MPRRRGGILMALGLVLALASGGMVFYVLRHAVPASADTSSAPLPTPVPMKPVVVAAHPLLAGAVLTTTDITVKQFPEELVSAGVMTDTSTMVGQTVLEPVAEGELIRPSQLGATGDGQLSKDIDKDSVVMAFSTDDLLNKSKAVHEGDHVDMLLTLDVKEESATDTREGKATSYTVQNIKVLRLVRDRPTEDNPNPETKAILFQMKPQDAVIAKFVKDSGGTLDLTLRSVLDTDTFTTNAINQDYLIDNFGFRAPQSSTHSKQQ